MRPLIARVLLLSSLLWQASCKIDGGGKTDPGNIRNSIKKCFGPNNIYISRKDIDFEVPNIVEVKMVGIHPQLGVAEFDVSWVGKSKNARKIEISSEGKIVGRFNIVVFNDAEDGNLDPVADEYTGQGVFSVPRLIWERLKGEDIEFVLTDANGNEYGCPFAAKGPEKYEKGIFKFEH